MATHSNILAWKIPWTEEPGRLWSMGLQKSQTRLSNQAPHARGMWDLTFPTRDRTHTLGSGSAEF